MNNVQYMAAISEQLTKRDYLEYRVEICPSATDFTICPIEKVGEIERKLNL